MATQPQTLAGLLPEITPKASTIAPWLLGKIRKPEPKAIKVAFWRWQVTRIILTVLILGYGAFVIVWYVTRKDDDQAGRDKLSFAQNVLWGDGGILGTVIMLWVFSLILLMIYPVIGETLKPIMDYFLQGESLI